MQSPYGQRARHVRSAASVESEARESYGRLKNVLAAQPPWSREVEIHRTQTRDLYLSLVFGHPLSSHAQSLEPIWLYTTYSLIAAYRSIVSRLEASLPPLGGGGGGPRRKPTPQHAELKKVVTRFRQILMSEEQFYRGLVSRLVAFYQLQSLAGESLAALSIGVASPVPDGGPDKGLAPPLSPEEHRDKLGLVYKALICLGDLERYREQYSDPARRDARQAKPSSSSSTLQQRYAKASSYYDVARGLVPDDGSAFNQLAVISTYVSDNFSCVYFYFRALAVKHAFKNIDEILNKFLRKVYERWVDKVQRRRRGDGDSEDDDDAKDAVEQTKSDLIVLVAILYRRNGLSSALKLESIVTETLAEQLRGRKVAAETVVRITAIVVGNYWYARQNAGLALQGGDPRLAQRRRQAELASLRLLVGIYGSVLDVGAEQVEEALKARANGSAVTLTDDDDEPELHIHISAVLRRLLPALRLLSKWLKLHLEHVTRVQQSGDLDRPIAVFWEKYTRFVIALATLFPIDHLPNLDQPLEEDFDMRGYIPLSFGMDRQSTGPIDEHDFHPNEEQLMRIADLQVDAKLLAQTSSGSRAMSPPTQVRPLPPFAHFGSTEQDGDRPDDSASVSTNTEDDPVNLAMRATLGGSSTDGDDDDDEVIVWSGRNTRANAPLQPIPTQPQSLVQTAPTAQDLLQNLILDTSTPSPQPPRQPAASGSGENSPGMLFGADASGASIWTMTRADSGRGSNRGSMQGAPGVNIAGIWGAPETLPPNPPGSGFQAPGHALPRTTWRRSSSSAGLGQGQVLGQVQGQGFPAGPPPGFTPPSGASGQGIWSTQGAAPLPSGWPQYQQTAVGAAPGQPPAHATQWANPAQYPR